jgi:hypothetical protein
MEEIRFIVEAGGWCWCWLWFCSLIHFLLSPFRTLVEEAAMSSEVTVVRLLKKENKERCCAMSFVQTNFPTRIATHLKWSSSRSMRKKTRQEIGG